MRTLRLKTLVRLGLTLLTILWLTACASDDPPTSPDIGQPVAEATSTPVPTATLPPPAPAQPTPLPADTATPLPPTPLSPIVYRVAFVAAGDTLNVRSGPGVANSVVGTLAYNATAVSITGAAETVDSSVWVPISYDRLTGWVNRFFLTEAVPAAQFCADPAVTELVNNLKSSLIAGNGEALAGLVHPQRGLLIRQAWWNSEVRLAVDEVAQLFVDTTSRDWGTADGSGLPIIGSTAEVIMPLLEKDLQGSTVSGCNEVVGGNTAGILRLPAEYEALNFVSQHRPATNDFDWGSWAIGIEYWQGKPYLTFLVHYTWEI